MNSLPPSGTKKRKSIANVFTQPPAGKSRLGMTNFQSMPFATIIGKKTGMKSKVPKQVKLAGTLKKLGA